MDAGDMTIGMDVTMQHRDITKAYQPCWPGFEFSPVNLIHDTQRSIASPGAHDCFYFLIVQHLLQVLTSFFVSATESKILFAYRISCLNLIAPALHDSSGWLNFFNFN